jgi:hypothetical protein
MTMLFYDPYKERKFAEIRGEKVDSFFRVYFEEASFYSTEQGYVLAGQMIKFSGVIRKFNPSESINPCLCTVTIYRKDYEARQKNKDGNWENIPRIITLSARAKKNYPPDANSGIQN